MGLSEEQQRMVVEKYHKAVEHQFSTLKDCQYGVTGGLGSHINYTN